MKKVHVLSGILLFTISSVFAAPFSPTLLKLNMPARITYKFDNTPLVVPMTVTGKPSNSVLMLYTKDKANEIGKVRNGALGWHYVNKLDTCVYMSPPIKLVTGSNTITWNGKDNNGSTVAAGAYTYFLFGYDNQNPMEPAIKSLGTNVLNVACIEGRDVKGIPLATPIMYFGLMKWTIGVDPQTPTSALESSTSGRTGIPRFGSKITLDPLDHNLFWQGEKSATFTLFITKYKWVPNAASTIETKWADNGTFTWTTVGLASLGACPGVVGDGKDLLFDSYWRQRDKVPGSELVVVSMADGSKQKTIDLQEWYVNKNDSDAGGQMSGGPSDLECQNGHLITQACKGCMVVAIDPYRDPGDEICWTNGNGDLVHDHNFELTALHPWMCNDYNSAPYAQAYSTDSEGFAYFSACDLGAVTFGLIGPAGTGVGYFSVSGESATDEYLKTRLDEGTAYDGFYLDNNNSSVTSERAGTWFLGMDTVKGVISSQIDVDAAAPAAFSVAQNSPNPFNPTTSISFTLAKAGQVTVDIYNAAGQKVDTVVNTKMNAGNHSATWNAARFSAGVYFYTVKSGDFSRTMKMTLLK